MALSIEEIRKFVNERKIKWRAHMLQRMRERNITRENVIEYILKGENYRTV